VVELQMYWRLLARKRARLQNIISYSKSTYDIHLVNTSVCNELLRGTLQLLV
jgi:hypothetical protein